MLESPPEDQWQCKGQCEGQSMTNLLGISGSLRRSSFNTALIRAAAARMPPEATLEVRTLHGIPLYDGDVDALMGASPGGFGTILSQTGWLPVLRRTRGAS
jgi:hypothetical protein